jgi:hypothetical protein
MTERIGPTPRARTFLITIRTVVIKSIDFPNNFRGSKNGVNNLAPAPAVFPRRLSICTAASLAALGVVWPPINPQFAQSRTSPTRVLVALARPHTIRPRSATGKTVIPVPSILTVSNSVCPPQEREVFPPAQSVPCPAPGRVFRIFPKLCDLSKLTCEECFSSPP